MNLNEVKEINDLIDKITLRPDILSMPFDSYAIAFMVRNLRAPLGNAVIRVGNELQSALHLAEIAYSKYEGRRI